MRRASTPPDGPPSTRSTRAENPAPKAWPVRLTSCRSRGASLPSSCRTAPGRRGGHRRTWLALRFRAGQEERGHQARGASRSKTASATSPASAPLRGGPANRRFMTWCSRLPSSRGLARLPPAPSRRLLVSRVLEAPTGTDSRRASPHSRDSSRDERCGPRNAHARAGQRGRASRAVGGTSPGSEARMSRVSARGAGVLLRRRAATSSSRAGGDDYPPRRYPSRDKREHALGRLLRADGASGGASMAAAPPGSASTTPSDSNSLVRRASTAASESRRPTTSSNLHRRSWHRRRHAALARRRAKGRLRAETGGRRRRPASLRPPGGAVAAR